MSLKHEKLNIWKTCTVIWLSVLFKLITGNIWRKRRWQKNNGNIYETRLEELAQWVSNERWGKQM